jgi:hypothetical protein
LGLIALQALLQVLARLAGAHVLSVVFARLRDSLVSTRGFRSLSFSVSARDEGGDQHKMCQFH